MCADAIDIFTFLRARGIGQGFALFYEAWAALLERKEVCVRVVVAVSSIWAAVVCYVHVLCLFLSNHARVNMPRLVFCFVI